MVDTNESAMLEEIWVAMDKIISESESEYVEIFPSDSVTKKRYKNGRPYTVTQCNISDLLFTRF